LTAQEITEIAWHPDDALPFAICISSRAGEAPKQKDVDNISVARGNIVLVDHGWTVKDEPLDLCQHQSFLIPQQPAATGAGPERQCRYHRDFVLHCSTAR
jgi:hypothetical protein